jgi:uncharacterized membrane protein YdbT with pleckstrin-like domain
MNTNWRTYLKSGDKVFSHTKVNKSISLCQSFLRAAIVAALLSAWVIAYGLQTEQVMSTVAIISILAGVFSYAHRQSFHFILTHSGVYSIGGLIFKTVKFVAYTRITDATIQRGIFEQIFNLGSIGISTAGGTKSYGGHSQPYEIVISSVSEYQKIRQEIFKKMK